MARPKKEGMDYFPHDTDAVNDEKIEALRMLYGNDGYAFYFILLERIYRNKNAELDVSDAETKQILSRKIGITIELFSEILETCLKRKCFDREVYEKRGFLTSEGIKNRALPVIQKRENMRSKYNVGVSDAETKQKGGVSAPKVKESKVKKSKEKESKEKEVLLSDPTEKLKDEIHQLAITCKIENLTLHGLDELFSYIGLVDKEVIEAAIKKGEGKHVNYALTILDDMYKEGIIKKEHLFQKSAPGKLNIRKDTLPSYISDQTKQEKIQKEETSEEEEARQKHIKEMMIELGEWDEDKN